MQRESDALFDHCQPKQLSIFEIGDLNLIKAVKRGW